MTLEAEWERWWKMAADPVVIARGHVWAYADWDFEQHGPQRGAQPRR